MVLSPSIITSYDSGIRIGNVDFPLNGFHFRVNSAKDLITIFPHGGDFVYRLDCSSVDADGDVLEGVDAVVDYLRSKGFSSGGGDGQGVTWGDIADKPSVFPPIIGTDATSAKAGNYVPSWASVTGKPTSFPPSAHNHNASAINAGVLAKARLPMNWGSVLQAFEGTITSFDIPHGLGAVPSSISLTFSDVTLYAASNYVISLDATNITLTYNDPPEASDITVYWQAYV